MTLSVEGSAFFITMIPLHKLKELPYSQGLRKTAKIFEDSERRFIHKGSISDEELLYLHDLLGLWITGVPRALGNALDSAQKTLKQDVRGPESCFPARPEVNIILRSLNTVHHLLRAETGQYPADWDFIGADSSGSLDPGQRRIFPGMDVYLEDIRSPFNVGAMFRSAESFGAEKLYLSPFCADPHHPRAQRTAMGCVSVLPWQKLENDPFLNPDPGNHDCPKSTCFLPETAYFALETGGTRLEDFHFPKHGVMIAGSEELGVSPNALATADASLGRLSIPIYGAKGSLNVSVAFGIAMQAWAASLIKNIHSAENMV